jgi:hypothetical protein
MRFLKFTVAVLLLPLLAAVAGSLLDLSRLLWAAREWGHPWFWALGGGLALWLVVWLLLPRPVWVYVLGHELTHALAVYLHLGKVHRIEVTSQGGHIVSDKNNWFISLAPYFIPLYTLIWLGLWWSISFYHPLGHYAWLLYGGIGFTWGFHLTFTVSMIGDGQSDLDGEGVFFSLVLIVLLNLLLIEGGLAALATRADFATLGRSLEHRTLACYRWTGHVIAVGTTTAWREIETRVAQRRGLH